MARTLTPWGSKPAARTAEQPGQTLNIDLCFVPQTHEIEIKLPAVSGSSGRLIVEALPSEKEAPNSPGQVFEDETLSYPQAMEKFVLASEAPTVYRCFPERRGGLCQG